MEGIDVAQAPAAPPARGHDGVPQLASGVELIGRFEDSGLREPPFIARRGDGQIVQLAPMLYALAEQVDGRRDTAQIAEAFSHRIERAVEPEMVEQLLDEQLRRLGIVVMADGHTGEVSKLDPLLALKFRTRVVPDSVVRPITTLFRHLFAPPVLALAIAAFVALDVWLFGIHGISQSLRHVLYQPALLLVLVAGVIVATAFHEIGHASAVRYGGAKPGVMGIGIYIVWPAFYTDITDAYRLGKWGRLRADTGGMYFNALFALAMGGVYAATGFEPILLLVVLQNFAIVQQALPFLRLDGYYIISDLTGVPDIYYRIKPVLRSLLPNRPADERVTELKPWVRAVVTGYVLTIVPVLLLVFLLVIVHAPRAFATGYDSVALHYQQAGPAFHRGRDLAGIVDVFQMLVLVLPSVGLVYTVGRLARRLVPGLWAWSADAPWRPPVVAAGGAALAGGLAFLWWPNGDYRPIQPTERGTLVSAIRSLGAIQTGQAALPAQRRQQLRGAPLLSQQVRNVPKPGNHPVSKHSKPTATTPTTTQTTPTTTATTPTTTQTGPTTTATTPTTTQTTPTTTATTPTTTQTTPTTTATTPTTTTTTP